MSNISQQGIETTATFKDLFSRTFFASIAIDTSEPVASIVKALLFFFGTEIMYAPLLAKLDVILLFLTIGIFCLVNEIIDGVFPCNGSVDGRELTNEELIAKVVNRFEWKMVHDKMNPDNWFLKTIQVIKNNIPERGDVVVFR